MMPGGKGGANTQTGIHFERKTDLLTEIAKLRGFSLSGNDVQKNGVTIAVNCQKHKLYKFLTEKKVDYKKVVSSILLPDEALYVPTQKKMYILEKKWQEGQGSVDEKLQTCAYKKQYYTRLLEPLKIEVEYIYVLSDWFMQKKYADVLNYVESCGCKYFFKELPLKVLGLS